MPNEQSRPIYQASIDAHDQLLRALSNLSLPGQIQEFPDFYEPDRMVQYYLHPLASRDELEAVRQQVGTIRGATLGAPTPTQGVFERSLQQERDQADRLYIVSWLGPEVPRGLEIEGYNVMGTQNGRMVAVPSEKSMYSREYTDLGTYERWVDPRDTQGSRLNVMAIYINSRNLQSGSPELPPAPDSPLLS